MYDRPIAFPMWPLLAALCACTGQTDAVSHHINACLLVTEAEAETAIGTPVSAAEKRSDTHCLYRAKRDAEEALAIAIDQESVRDRKSLFSSELVKSDGTLIAGVGDAAFVFPPPSGGVQLTFLKDDALVDVTITPSSHGEGRRSVETVVRLGKTAARRMAQQTTTDSDQARAEKSVSRSALWTGDWYGCHPVGALKTKGHLVLTSSGHWALTAATVTPGTLFADKGHWQIESLHDILHGTYQLAGADTFATTGILSIRWDKIAKDQGSTRFDPTLYRSLTGVPHKVTVRRLPPVDPALVGLWEGSAKYVDRRDDFVWLITANNVTEFYKAVHWGGIMERDGDGFRLATLQGATVPFHLKVLNESRLEVTSSEDSTSQWERKEATLATC